MRLTEIAPPNYGREQAATLLTILNHIQSKVGNGVEVPFERINQLMNNAGYPFSFETFVSLYNTSPNIHNAIDNYNKRVVTIGQSEPSMGDGKPDSDAVVDRMAKTAAKKAIK
jgi:hypothetical protein